jgi:hypothetical protein
LVDLRVLTGAEELSLLHKAKTTAKDRGSETPVDGDRVFELCRMAATLELAVLDHDSPADAPAPFFDGGVGVILDELDSDRIAFLYARWRVWQDECSPQLRGMKVDEYYSRLLAVVAAEDDLPFSQMSPGMQCLLLRTTGALLLGSPEGKSAFLSAFSAKQKEPTKAPEQ